MRRTIDAILIIGLAALASSTFAQAPEPSRINPEDSNEAIRQVRLLDAYVEQSSWNEAAELLENMIEGYPFQVIPIPNAAPARYVAIRSYCQKRIAQLPAEALAMYRERVDGRADALWNDFETTDNVAPLLRIVDEFFTSSVGDRACEALGDHALAKGNFDGAVEYWTRLLPLATDEANRQDDEVLVRFPDPKVDIRKLWAKWTVGQLLRGDHAQAQRGLQVVKDKFADATGRIGNREGRYLDLLTDLSRDASVWQRPTPSPGWPTFGGNFSRSKIAAPAPRIGTLDRRWNLLAAPDADNSEEREPLEADARFPFEPVPKPTVPREGLYLHPVTEGASVYVSDGRRLYEFEADAADTDKPAWTFDFNVEEGGRTGLGAQATRHTVTLSGSFLFARSGTVFSAFPSHFAGRPLPTPSQLYCFDREQRRLLWWVPASAMGVGAQAVFDGAPVIHGDHVLIGLTRIDAMSTAYVVCLDKESGQVRWTRLICEATNDLERPSAPDQNLLALSGDTLFYCTNLGAVAALDVRLGKVKWLTEYLDEPALGARSRSLDISPCVYDRGRLFVSTSGSGGVYCFDAATGEIQWRQRIAAEHLLGVAKNRLILTGDRVWALDADTGAIDWRFPENEPGGVGRGMLAGDSVYWPTASEIHVLDQETGRRAQAPISLFEALRLRPGNLIPGDGYIVLAQKRSLVVLRPYRWLKEQREIQVAQNPQSAKAHYLLAQAASLDGDLTAAVEHYQQAASLARPGEVHAGQLLADLARHDLYQSLLAAAHAHGELALKKAPVSSSDLGEMNRLYDQAVSAAPTNSSRLSSIVDWARFETSAGQLAEATAHYQSILDSPELRTARWTSNGGALTSGSRIATRELHPLVKGNEGTLYLAQEEKLASEFDRASFDERLALAERFPLARDLARRLLQWAGELEKTRQPWQGVKVAARVIDSPAARDEEKAEALLILERLHASRGYSRTANALRARLSREYGDIAFPGGDPSTFAEYVSTRSSPPPDAPLAHFRLAWRSDDAPGSVHLPEGEPAGDSFLSTIHLVENETLVRSARDGRVAWRLSEPLLDTRFVHSIAGLVCLGPERIQMRDYETGEVLWSLDLPIDRSHEWKEVGSAVEGELRRRADTIIPQSHADDRGIVVWSPRMGMTLIDLFRGEILWQIDVSHSDGNALRDPQQLWTTGDRVVIFASHRVIGLDRATGDIQWSMPTKERIRTRSWAYAGGRLIVATARDQITALDPMDGTVAWELSTAWPTWGGPKLFGQGDRLLAQINGFILADIDVASGEKRWESVVTRDPDQSEPSRYLVTSHDVVIYHDQGVANFDVRTGVLKWSSATRGIVGLWQDGEQLVGLDLRGELLRLRHWNLTTGQVTNTMDAGAISEIAQWRAGPDGILLVGPETTMFLARSTETAAPRGQGNE